MLQRLMCRQAKLEQSSLLGLATLERKSLLDLATLEQKSLELILACREECIFSFRAIQA